MPDEIENYLWDTGYYYGEWLIPSQSRNVLDMENLGTIMAASACYTAPIFGWFSVHTFAEICGILAERYPADQGNYKELEKKYRATVVGIFVPQLIGTLGTEKSGWTIIALVTMPTLVMPIFLAVVPAISRKIGTGRVLKARFL